jgi:hypothetical protein
MDNARIQDHYIHDRDAHGTVNGPVWHPTPPNTLASTRRNRTHGIWRGRKCPGSTCVMNTAVPHRGAWRRVLVIRLFMRNPEAMRIFFARPAGGGIAFRTAGCPAVTTCARLTPPPPGRVSLREASKRDGLMMVTRRIRYGCAPAVGYGVPSLPMGVQAERIRVVGGSCA